jgi:prepilin-type processing-associated H-X9-DG protein
MCDCSVTEQPDSFRYRCSRGTGGFTLISLLSILLVLALLLPIFYASLARRWSVRNDSTFCMNNLRQLAYAMQLYTEDNNGVFPAHRNNSGLNDSPRLEWWGINILGFAKNETNLFRCPAVKGIRVDRGVRWQWAFDAHQVGYGYNGFFLGVHPYEPHSVTVSGLVFTGKKWLNRSSIVKPSENILFADKQPYGNPPVWSSTLWWPNACMSTRASTSKAYEGVETLRHKGVGVVAFNDGHVEFRQDSSINPPADPSSGNPKAIINSRFWDPQHQGK